MSAVHVRDMHASNHANNLEEKVKRKVTTVSMYDTNRMASDKEMDGERLISYTVFPLSWKQGVHIRLQAV